MTSLLFICQVIKPLKIDESIGSLEAMLNSREEKVVNIVGYRFRDKSNLCCSTLAINPKQTKLEVYQLIIPGPNTISSIVQPGDYMLYRSNAASLQ